jgi:uncharacterized protein (TIGR02391 family)
MGEKEKEQERQLPPILKEIIEFRNDLYEYANVYMDIIKVYHPTENTLNKLNESHAKVLYKLGALETLIEETSGMTHINLKNSWVKALNVTLRENNKEDLMICMQATTRSLGRLEDDIKKGKRDVQGNLITTGEISGKKALITDTTESPINLFSAMHLHPKVAEASKSCFTTINYREAILNAFISFIDYVKEISGLDLDGDDLMNNVFSFYYDKEQKKITKYPVICINELKNKTDRDEQQGFMFLCKGAAAFIRNPKAHKLIVQKDPLHTLEYLGFASMLFKQLDKRIHKETSS